MQVVVYAVGPSGCVLLVPPPGADVATVQKDVPVGATSVAIDTSGLPAGDPSSWSLTNGAVTAMPLSAVKLSAYANAKQGALLSASQSYSVGGTPPLSVLADATASTQFDLQALYDWGAANPTATQLWVDNNGDVVPVTGAQFVTLRPLVKAYRIAVYATLGVILRGIAASPPTIKTTADIDAAAWPTSSV